jgi:hypothetical protein
MLVNNYMATSEIGQRHSVRSLFSKFQAVENKVIADYISSFPESLSEAVDKVLSRNDQSPVIAETVMSNRARIVKYIDNFHHQAGTNTSKVKEGLAALQRPSTEVLVSIHQPNLFAFAGVYKKIILLQCLKSIAERRDRNRKFVNLFLIVDHDFMDEFWIRHAQLPSIRHANGVLELRFPIRAHDRWRLMHNMHAPSSSLIDFWRKQVSYWLRNTNSALFPRREDKSQLIKNFDDFWDEVLESYSRCKSYADFNSFIISRLVNKVWDYDTLFVRLSDIPEVFEDGFKFLISNYKKYAIALNHSEAIFTSQGINTGVSSSSYLNAPVWLHCKCGSKGSAKLVETKTQHLSLIGKCIACKSDLRIEIGSRSDIDLSGDKIHSISPRAIPILLLLARELGIGCYASGTGGSLGYMLVGSLAFEQLNVNMPITTVWPAVDVYTGVGQSEALNYVRVNDEKELESYLDRLKGMDSGFTERIAPLINERSMRIRSAQSINDILNELFPLKESQRTVRRTIKMATKARSAINLKPCMIDYTVNFGMSGIEAQWRERLTTNNHLATPVSLIT